MIGWKILDRCDGQYVTPFRRKRIRPNQKFMIARGKKEIEQQFWSQSKEYGGGFIHCYRTRSIARKNKAFSERVIKVKCYNVRAFGTVGDLVCDKIEFLWEE